MTFLQELRAAELAALFLLQAWPQPPERATTKSQHCCVAALCACPYSLGAALAQKLQIVMAVTELAGSGNVGRRRGDYDYKTDSNNLCAGFGRHRWHRGRIVRRTSAAAGLLCTLLTGGLLLRTCSPPLVASPPPWPWSFED